MTPRLRYSHWLPRLLRVDAITIYPWIFFAEDTASTALEYHELVHFYQVRAHGWLSFYLGYLLYYFVGLITFRSHTKAYHEIPFEKDAYGD